MSRHTSTARVDVSPRKRGSNLPVMDLRTLRESLGKTQGEVARNAEMTQPQLSRVERRRDHLLSTVRRYAAALGGEVQVIVRVDGRQIILRDI
jgi:predicted transcriptional regulator